MKKKNILAENMRRFGTKNLKENVKLDPRFGEELKDIYRKLQQGEFVTDEIIDEMGDFYEEVYESGDLKLIQLYDNLRSVAEDEPEDQFPPVIALLKYIDNPGKNLKEQKVNSIRGEIIDKYVMSLKRKDVKVISDKLNPEDIYDDTYDASFNDTTFRKEINLETPKFILNLELISNLSGGGEYGDDAEIQYEFFIDNVIDRSTKKPIKVDYSAPYKETPYLDYHIGELLGLY